MGKCRAAVLAAAIAPAVILPAGAAVAGSVTLFSEPGFRGPNITVNQDVRNLADFPPWNDRARSLIVNSGSWEICKDSKYRDCVTLPPGAQIPDLDEVGLYRKVSSLREVQNMGWNDRWDNRWDDRRWDGPGWDRPVVSRNHWDERWDRGDRWEGDGLSACQRRVYAGMVDRFGYRAPARFRGSPWEGDIGWDGRWWHYSCSGGRINIWR